MKKQNRLFLLIMILFLINVQVCQAARVTGDQIVLYTFKEGSGTTVNDVSGVGSALNLTVASEAAISWIPGGGLSVDASTIIESSAASTKVIDAVKTSNEISIEAWVKPANTTQVGPARIVTISADPYFRNFTLGQETNTYDVRLRTTSTSLNGIPSVLTTAGTVTTNLTHLVYTRDALGAVKIFIDGNEEANGTIGGNCSNWDDSYNLALANELTNDRSWLGEIYLVAIYGRSLTEPEVDQNFAEGAIVECNVDGDCDDANVCTDDTCAGNVCQYSYNTASCDDFIACTEIDTCSGGACNGTPNNTLCTDGNSCTDDICTVGVGCSNPDNTASCDDGIACTEIDTCSGGACNGTPNNTLCSDGNSCTDDICTVGVGCSNPNNTASCDDGIACTEIDTCSGGACNGTPNNTLCSDGNSCTDDICTVGVGCSNPNNTASCDDGIACTEIDTCSGGACNGTPNNTLCSDGNSCTDDICTVGVGCSNPNNTASCDDGIACTEIDTCSGGACNGTPNNTLCTDGNSCTDDICTVGVGCSNPDNTASCDDSIFCNGTDTCNGGSCLHAGSPCPETECNTCQEATDSCFDPGGTVCADDGNVCTDDECDGSGVCTHPNNTDPCDDGLFCTQTDECQGGLCIGWDDPCLDDGDFCSGVEHCQEGLESFLCNSTGDPCDLLLICDEVGDVCDVSDVSLSIADDFGYAGTIDIGLENSLDSVGEVHVDVCDVDQRDWLHIDTGSCDTTVRSSEFSCVISDLGGGCVRVDLITISGVINPGIGVIAQLTYSIDATAPMGDFADLTPKNSDLRDDTAASLSVTPKPGMVGVVECTVDGDCDDSNVCTDDACVGTVCQYSNNTASCDDGLFCTGADSCSDGSCSVHSGDSCSSGATCNEITDSCNSIPASTTTTINVSPITECETDADCDDDELFCNGDEVCLEGGCRHEGSPCPDDEIFCNGEESCDEANDECISSGNPCLGSTACFEETEECRFMGKCSISIESETTALVSEQTLNFTITETGDCGDADYEWSVQSDIGSIIDQNGNFAAGINADCVQKATDIIKIIDSANDITVEKIVTVSCDRIKEVINISNPLWILSPSDIYSSQWLQIPYILLIFAEQGNFNSKSSLNFEPVGSVTTLFNLGRDNFMIALVLVGPDAQDGPCRARVTTGSHMVTKKDALRIYMMPWILDEENNHY